MVVLLGIQTSTSALIFIPRGLASSNRRFVFQVTVSPIPSSSPFNLLNSTATSSLRLGSFNHVVSIVSFILAAAFSTLSGSGEIFESATDPPTTPSFLPNYHHI